MQARNVTTEILITAANEIGVSLNMTTQNARGTRHRVKLYPITPASAWAVARWPRLCPICGEKVARSGETTDGRIIGTCGDAAPAEKWANFRRYKDERGDAQYQRTSASSFHSERRVNAVCWHGFRDFFRAVYRIKPDAVFATAFDTWRGSEDFEERHEATGHKNVGSESYPMAAAEACRCSESGTVYNNTRTRVGGDHQIGGDTYLEYRTNPVDTYGTDEADGAACRAMANALRAAGR